MAMHDMGYEESAGTRYLRRRMALLTGCVSILCLGVAGLIGFFFWQRTAESSKEQKRAAIAQVLRQHNRILADEQKRRKEKTLPGAVEAARRVSAQFRQLDTRACPDDFREAFLKYCQAFANVVDVMQELPQSEMDAFLVMVFNGLGGKRDGGVGEMRREVKEAKRQFRTAQENLEVVLLRYDI